MQVEAVHYLVEITPSLSQSSFIIFLDKWQTMIGSALGVFAAALIPLASYWWNKKSNTLSERRENLRRVEVAITTSFQETINVQKLITLAITSINEVIADVRRCTDPQQYALDQTNFPVSGEIYRDPDMRMLRTDSYYLHNKLLIFDTLLKDMNRLIKDFKSDYQDHIRRNEWMATKARPSNQREMYAQNLRSFSLALEEYLKTQFPIALKLAMQIKIYNGFLRKDYKATLKNYEGKNFCLWEKLSISHPVNGLETIKGIDDRIENEVEAEISAVKREMNKESSGN